MCVYYLVGVGITRRCWERFLRSAVYPIQWMRLMLRCVMTVKRKGMLGVSVGEMKALTEDRDSDTDW